MEHIEKYVKMFGEENRQLIIDSLEWLNQREKNWNLPKPLDRKEFLISLIRLKNKELNKEK